MIMAMHYLKNQLPQIFKKNLKKVIRTTVDKWIVENDKTLKTIWLKYVLVVGDCEHVSALKYGACIQFHKQLQNYNSEFINGSKNTRTSSFKEYTQMKMDKPSVSSYIPRIFVIKCLSQKQFYNH